VSPGALARYGGIATELICLSFGISLSRLPRGLRPKNPVNYNSWTFWILFALVIVRYWRLSHRHQNDLLLVASYFFYGFWTTVLFLILISTNIDYIGGLGVAGIRLTTDRIRRLGVLTVGSAILLCANVRYPDLFQGFVELDWKRVLEALPHTLRDFYIPIAVAVVCLTYGRALPWLYELPEAARRKYFLVISMVANLGILGFFKYFDFFIDNFRTLVMSMGFGEPSWTTLGILLPAGISFYTFQAMSYTIDIYRGRTKPTQHFSRFCPVCVFLSRILSPVRSCARTPCCHRSSTRAVWPPAHLKKACISLSLACSRKSLSPTTWQSSPTTCSIASSMVRPRR